MTWQDCSPSSSTRPASHMLTGAVALLGMVCSQRQQLSVSNCCSLIQCSPLPALRASMRGFPSGELCSPHPQLPHKLAGAAVSTEANPQVPHRICPRSGSLGLQWALRPSPMRPVHCSNTHRWYSSLAHPGTYSSASLCGYQQAVDSYSVQLFRVGGFLGLTQTCPPVPPL